MKRPLKVIVILLLAVGLATGVRLFHLGPFGIHLGDDLALARFTTTNGVRLCVIAHRTQNVTEPYEVTLYRIEPNGEVFSYWMGYEDSFWWACSIRPTKDPRILHIRADASVVAVYHVDHHSLTFPDDYYRYGVQTGLTAASNTVPLVIAQRELK